MVVAIGAVVFADLTNAGTSTEGPWAARGLCAGWLRLEQRMAVPCGNQTLFRVATLQYMQLWLVCI